MEDKVISLGKGIHREPSVGAVGELTDCINLYSSEGGEMKLLQKPSETYYVGNGEVAKFIHKTGDGAKHLIVVHTETTGTGENATTTRAIKWRPLEGDKESTVTSIVTLGSDESINDITAMGNVLVIATSAKMYYYLWVDSGYRDYTFDDLEDLDIQFALDGTYEQSAETSVKIKRIGKEIELYTEGVPTTTGDRLIRVSAEQLRAEATYLNEFKVIKYNTSTQSIESQTISTRFIEIEYSNLVYNKSYNVHIESLSKDTGVGFNVYLHYKNKEYCWDFSSINQESGDSTIVHNNTIYVGNFGSTAAAAKYKEYYGTATVDKIIIAIPATYSKANRDKYEKGSILFGLRNIDDNVPADSFDYYSSYVLGREEENLSAFTGAINKFIDSNGKNANKFIYPFFVRYAIKLVDGSIIKPSTPILMIPNSGVVPHALINKTIDTNETEIDVTPVLTAFAAKLQYKIQNSTAVNLLKAKCSIMDSIVIGVTSPIYSYKSNITEDDKIKYFFCKKSVDDSIGYLKLSAYSTSYDRYSLNGKDSGLSANCCITIPTYDEKESIENIENASTFRIVSEIKIDSNLNVGESFTDVSMNTGTLNGLDAKAIIEDNAGTLKKLNAKSLYAYNNRLTLGNLKEEMYKGYAASIMTGFKSGATTELAIEIEITKNNQTYKVRRKCTYANNMGIMFFYYPDADAKNATIYRKVNNVVIVSSITLKKHPHLNGAYWFGNFEELPSAGSTASKTFDSLIDLSASYVNTNKVISSLVNNPFVIDYNTASLVGVGEVQKLVANTKALSQGQFGQHPVLAFCTDGIWALSISSDGAFNAVQPISRDVVNNVDNITQLDNTIVFTTDKGLMLLDGSNVRQLCKYMDNKDPFPISNVSSLYTTLTGGIFKNEQDELFVDMLKTCKIVPDYVNQLLWIYPHIEQTSEGVIDMARQYVVSLESGEIYTYIDAASDNSDILLGPESIVVDYPQSLVQFYKLQFNEDLSFNKTTNLYTFKKETSDTIKPGYLLTRAIPFDDAYTMKMLYDMKVEWLKMSDVSSLKVAVFVSNDRVHWGRLTSLKARSFKWYRFAVFCKFSDYDRLTGLVCRIDNRRTNKLR